LKKKGRFWHGIIIKGGIMEFDDIGIQYYRLLRHYNFAIKNSDPISFLDLSHVLRIWVDMKSNIDNLLKNDYPSIRFKNPRKSKKVDKILKGSKYRFLPLASGVDSPGVQIKGFHFIDRALTPDEVKKLYDAGPPELKTTNISFSEWLSSGIYKVPDLENDGLELSISREILIKRVANLLGASHPQGTDIGQTNENRFDKYIVDLHSMKLADGFPATYYQLLEIAKDILDTLKTIFMKPE
jgi:hypothetical protein